MEQRDGIGVGPRVSSSDSSSARLHDVSGGHAMRQPVPLVLLSITLSIVATVLAAVGARVVRDARGRGEGHRQAQVPA